ncbi:MAG: hypothetical protein GEU95_17700 [Rhizobiales bacterium]|nr:hypothetical protein [Hyphomicrobiales bacterium]
MVKKNLIRVMAKGSDWYWEVVDFERQVIARGLAQTHADAVADAEVAAANDRALQAFQANYPS